MAKNDEKNKKKALKISRKKTLNILFFSGFFIIFLSFGEKNGGFEYFLSKNDQNNTFSINEKLKYKISYGKKNKRRGAIFAAHAHFYVQDSVINKKPVYKLSGRGKTTRLFSLFMNVEHYYTSIVDQNQLNTLECKMNIREGKYKKTDQLNLHSDIYLETKTINDVLGVVYKLRTIPHTELISKDTIFFSYYYDKKIYDSYLVKIGKEKIKTKFGELNTVRYSPLLEKGRMFKQTTGATIWISDDQRHIPIKIELPILVGSVYINLISYENLFFDLKN